MRQAHPNLLQERRHSGRSRAGAGFARPTRMSALLDAGVWAARRFGRRLVGRCKRRRPPEGRRTSCPLPRSEPAKQARCPRADLFTIPGPAIATPSPCTRGVHRMHGGVAGKPAWGAGSDRPAHSKADSLIQIDRRGESSQLAARSLTRVGRAAVGWLLPARSITT